MFEASFHFTLSSKDKQILVVSGHEYYLKRKNKTTTNWNCSKYQTHKCRATAITDGENFIETRSQHNHDIFFKTLNPPETLIIIVVIKGALSSLVLLYDIRFTRKKTLSQNLSKGFVSFILTSFSKLACRRKIWQFIRKHPIFFCFKIPVLITS